MTDLDATLDGATQVMASNMSIIGRDEINDMEAIFNLIGRIDEKGHHEVVDNCPAMFTWDYEKGFRPALDKLYEKAKRSQWNGSTDLDWSTPVDQEALAHQAYVDGSRGPLAAASLDGTRRCRGLTPSTTPQPKSWTKPVTLKSSRGTSTPSSRVTTR